MARPNKNIDREQFEQLCSLQCTQKQICDFFHTTDKTLNAWCKRTYKTGFSEAYSRARQPGLVSLRRTQFRLAEKSAPMAIFLGINYLEQKNEVTTEIKGDPVQIVIDV